MTPVAFPTLRSGEESPLPWLRMTSAVAGPFVAASALLGVAGVVKLVRPAGTVEALRAAALPGSAPLSRALGAAELAVAVAAVAVGSRPLALLVVASYLGFAGFTMRLIARRGGTAGCGCFGEARTPASSLHVVLNLALAATAVLGAIAPPGGVADVLAVQPLAGIPFLALTALCTWLAFVAFTLLPEVTAAAAERAA